MKNAAETMPHDIRPTNLDTLTKAMHDIRNLRIPDEWIVIDPQGRMYRGHASEMIKVLLVVDSLLGMPK